MMLASCDTVPTTTEIAKPAAPVGQPLPYRWTHGNAEKARKAMIDKLTEEEQEVSYRRRLLHGRLRVRVVRDHVVVPDLRRTFLVEGAEDDAPANRDAA